MIFIPFSYFTFVVPNFSTTNIFTFSLKKKNYVRFSHPRTARRVGTSQQTKLRFTLCTPGPCFWAELCLSPILASPEVAGGRPELGQSYSEEESPESPVLTAASQISWCPGTLRSPRRNSPGPGEHQWVGCPRPARWCYLQATGNEITT